MSDDEYYHFAKRIIMWNGTCLRGRSNKAIVVEIFHDIALNIELSSHYFDSSAPPNFDVERCLLDYFHRYASRVRLGYQLFTGSMDKDGKISMYFRDLEKIATSYKSFTVRFILQYDDPIQFNKMKLTQPELNELHDLGW